MHTIVSKFNILSILTFIIVLSSLPLSKVRQRCVITSDVNIDFFVNLDIEF